MNQTDLIKQIYSNYLSKIIDAINQQFSLSKQKPKFKGLLTTGNIDNKKVYAIKCDRNV